MAGDILTCKFTLKDVEDATVDATIDWDTDNAGTLVTTHNALASNGVVTHEFTQAVLQDRQYVVKVTAVDSAGNNAIATRSVQVIADQGPEIVIISLTSGV